MFKKLWENIQGRLTTASTARPAGRPTPTSAQGPSPWHAVSIRGGDCGRCEAAKSLAGLRFLSGEAPALPLPDCDRPDACRCRYQKHSDRRTPGEALDRHGIPLPHPERREDD